MTAPKEGRGLRRLAWPPRRATDAMTRSTAQFWFLCAVDQLDPRVLRELADCHTDADLEVWAARWRLTAPWCLRQASHTLAEHRAGHIDVRRHGWGDAVHIPSGWAGDIAADPPALTHKDPEHFEWLARIVVDPAVSYAALARAAGKEVQTVHEACRVLATYLGLPLPARRRGRPSSP